GDDVLAEVVVAFGPGRVLAEQFVHRPGGEDVDAHRRQAHLRVVRHRPRLARLLLEADHAVLRVHLHDAEVLAVLERHGQAADGQVQAAVDVRPDHVAVVHLVDVVAGEDEDVLRVGLLDAVDVLVDGVGGALVPVLVDALLRRQDLDVLVHLARQAGPAGADRAVEAAGLVLGPGPDAGPGAVGAV